MILVELHIRCIAQNIFDELVSRLNGFESMQRNRVLYTRIVGVEGDNVLYAHRGQLLQAECAVERLSSGSFMLTAFVQEWHNNIDSTGFSTDSCNDTLQILEMVIRRHVVCVAAKRIRQTVIADIKQNVDIISADRFVDDTFCLSRTETRNLRLNDIAVALIAFVGGNVFLSKFISASFSPLNQVIVDFFSKCGAAVQRNQSQSSDWQCVKMSFSSLTHALVPPKSFFWIRISFPKSLMMV